MAKKSVVFFCAACFLAGNAGASFFVVPLVLILLFGTIGLILTVIFRQPWILFLLMLSLGFLSWNRNSLRQVPEPPPEMLQTTGEIQFVETKINKQLATVRISQGELIGSKVLLYLDRYPEYLPGQHLDFRCRFAKPEPIEDFRYDRYLALSQIYYICYRPQAVTSGSQVSWRIWLFHIKRFYSQSYTRHLPEPEATVIRAMNLAERKELTSKLSREFSRAGLSHVMAISGMNMTLLVGALQAVALALTWRRLFTFTLTLGVLSLYVFIIGFQASAVRAAVMAIALLFSQVVHRQYDPWHVLILIAALLTAANPLSLMYDIGWQLSFLAMAGLIFWQKHFEHWLRWLPDRFGCRAIAAASLAAQVFTWPLMIYYFQTFSNVFLLTNILALPAVDVLTVAALVAPLIWWLPIIGWGVVMVILFLIRWLLLVCSVASSFPWAAVSLSRLAWYWYLIVYLVLIFITRYVESRKKT